MASSDFESGLRDSIEAQLACLICHERLQTPVILSCSHTFCSICIRNWLKVNKRCPVCSKATEPSNLIPNRILEPILKLIDSSPSRPARNASLDSQPDRNLVPCPKCSRSIASEEISSHLDNCLSENREVERPRQRLPVVSVNIVSDKGLRNHLSRYGLSTRGPRPELEARWSEFATLFEANEDRPEPAPLAQVVRMVEKQERSRNHSNNGPPSPFLRNPSTSGCGDNSFGSLISQLQQQKKRKLAELIQVESPNDQAMNILSCPDEDIRFHSHTTPPLPTLIEDDECLPLPWRKVFSTAYGRPMYYNQETKEGTFRCPVTSSRHQRADSLVSSNGTAFQF